MKSHKKEIIYPIFLQVSQLATDVFWMYLFEDLAYSTCPFGVCMDNGTIYCRFKGKKFNYNFQDKDYKEIYTQLVDIMKTKMNIYSKMDYLNNRSEFNNFLQHANYKEWKEIKKKNIKDVLIENFVIHMKNKYNLTDAQTQRVLCVINIGFHFKIITNNDIEYDSTNCLITNINGIDFQNLSNKTITMPSIGIPKIDIYENQSIEKQKMSELWFKYFF